MNLLGPGHGILCQLELLSFTYERLSHLVGLAQRELFLGIVLLIQVLEAS